MAGRAVSVWLGMAGVAAVGLWWAQRRSEAALDALPPADADRVGERVAVPSLVALGVIALALALFLALGRGLQGLGVAVSMLVANAWVLLAVRWWAARGVEGAGPWRAWVVAQAVAATAMFVAAAGHLRGW